MTTRVSKQQEPKALDANMWDYYELLSEELGGFSIALSTDDGRPGCLAANYPYDDTDPRLELFCRIGVDAPGFECAILDVLGVKHVSPDDPRYCHIQHPDQFEKRVPWAKIAAELNIVRGPHPKSDSEWLRYGWDADHGQCRNPECACWAGGW